MSELPAGPPALQPPAPHRVEPPAHEPPYPPWELAMRVGCTKSAHDPWAAYERVGRETREALLGRLPPGWTFEGKRVLDFGCGAGRTLRHFLAEARQAELHGCDIDAESISWLARNLSPPLRVSEIDERPVLPYPDRHFDLIWAASVFTHIADGWAGWLAELHRVLAEDGLLIATFIFPRAGSRLAFARIGDSAVDDDHVGINSFGVGRPQGAPVVVHSQWWLRAHWGRGFEIEELAEAGFRRPRDQGFMLCRRRPGQLTAAELERPEPGEPRELAAAHENLRQLAAELAHAWGSWDELRRNSGP